MKLKTNLILSIFALLINFSYAQVPSYIPKDSLVGWWPFDGDVNDYSGNNNHGTANNLVSDKDKNGNNNKCYSFNGTSSYISLPNNPNLRLTRNWSISVWVYTNGFNGASNYQTIFSKRNDQGIWAYSLSLSYTGNINENKKLLSARRDNNLSIDLLYSKDTFKQKSWFHVVASCNNDTLSYYINGIEVGKKQKFNLVASDQNIDAVIGRICACNSNHPEWFNGKLDDFGIWSRALDSNEVKNLYYSCKSNVLIQPSDCGTFNGNASFKFHVSDTTSKFQWQINQGTGWTNLINAGQFSGTTDDSLIVKNITLSNDGQLFRCISKANCGNNTSREAKLSVWGVNTNSINKQAFILSPNPVKDRLHIQGVQTNANYQITNALGQTFMQGKLTEKLDVSELKSGVYFFKTETGTQRFVKE